MKKNKVAVLMAVYNGERFLAEQIESILSQAEVDVDIIISIDKSTDSSLRICEEYSAIHKNIKILEYGEKFGSAGKNFFRLVRDLRLNDYNFVSFSDQDDIWLENKLSNAILAIRDKQAKVVSSDVLAFWQDGRRKLIKKSYPQSTFDYFYEAAGPGCTYVFSSDVFRGIQKFIIKNKDGLESVALHDWVIYAYCRHHGIKWYINPEPLMLYRQHEVNQVGSNSGLAAYWKRIKMIREGWYRNQVYAIASIVNPSLADRLSSRWFVIKNFWILRRNKRESFLLLFFAILGIY